MQPRSTLTFFIFAAHWTHCLLMTPRTHRSFSTKLLYSWLSPSMCWCLSIFLPRCRNLALSYVQLHEVPVSPFLASLMRSLSTPQSCMSSAILLRVHSVPSSKSLTKTDSITLFQYYSFPIMLNLVKKKII